MILALLLLQAGGVHPQPPVIAYPAPPPRVRETMAPGEAIRLFRDICLYRLEDRAWTAKAARRAGFRRDPEAPPEIPADSWLKGVASIQYNPAGMLPPHVDQPQCMLRTWFGARVSETDFRRRFTRAVRPGTLTRTDPVLVWERPARGGRVESIALQWNRLSHGQIVAVLSTVLRADAPRP
jgi:hypothetical protein